MKCEKCGHFNPYWRTDWRDTEREFAKMEDVHWFSLFYEIPMIAFFVMMFGAALLGDH